MMIWDRCVFPLVHRYPASKKFHVFQVKPVLTKEFFCSLDDIFSIIGYGHIQIGILEQ